MPEGDTIFREFEVMFICRVNPFTLVRDLSDTDLAAIVDTARRVLCANVPEDSGERRGGAIRSNGCGSMGAPDCRAGGAGQRFVCGSRERTRDSRTGARGARGAIPHH